MAVDVSGLLLSTELKERSMFLVASLVTTQPQTPPAAQFGADGDSYQAVSARATAVHDPVGGSDGISAGSRAASETVNAVTRS